MISSYSEYKFYLERDRKASHIPPFNTLKSKIKNLFFLMSNDVSLRHYDF